MEGVERGGVVSGGVDRGGVVSGGGREGRGGEWRGQQGRGAQWRGTGRRKGVGTSGAQNYCPLGCLATVKINQSA